MYSIVLGIEQPHQVTLPAPTVSVVMSVYNGEYHLAEAIRSVLAQTYTDFEFIIVNDGSTDRTPDILASFSDPRIHVVQQSNQGLAASLNAGIALTQGKFIARQDADDLWHPDKLAKQVPVLEQNQSIDLVASQTEVFDDEGEGPVLMVTASTDPRIETPFAHASVLIRKSTLIAVGGYDGRLRYAQDRDLWLRLYNGSNFYVLREVLVSYRAGRDQSAIKLLTFPLYLQLVQRVAGVPLDQRDAIIAAAMETIQEHERSARELICRGKIDVQALMDQHYHLQWANRNLKNGNSRRARQHFRSIGVSRLSFSDKVKYLLTYLPGSVVVPAMQLRLRMANLSHIMLSRWSAILERPGAR